MQDATACKSLVDRKTIKDLERWGLSDIKAVRARYAAPATSNDATAVVRAVLAADGVKEALELPADLEPVAAERLRTTAVSMALFDPVLDDERIVGPTGRAKQCPEIDVAGAPVSDELRKRLPGRYPNCMVPSRCSFFVRGVGRACPCEHAVEVLAKFGGCPDPAVGYRTGGCYEARRATTTTSTRRRSPLI